MFARGSAVLVNGTRRIGSKTFVPFRKIAEDSDGSTSCDTQLNCRTLFIIATALLICLVVLQPSSAQMSTMRRTYIPIYIREDANTHKAIWCKYLSRSILHGGRLNFSDCLLPLAFFLDTLLLRVFEDCGSEGGAAFGVGFARSLLSCQKLHWSPFKHCPFSFHWNKHLFLFQHHLIPCNS